jgi:hypothetical protein
MYASWNFDAHPYAFDNILKGRESFLHKIALSPCYSLTLGAEK